MDVRYYEDENGKMPVKEWISNLRDLITKRRIFSGIDKLRVGNFGDSKSVGEGISELRLHFGSGYRVYYSQQGQETILLLLAGDKSVQSQDILKAKEYLENYRERLKKLNEKPT